MKSGICTKSSVQWMFSLFVASILLLGCNPRAHNGQLTSMESEKSGLDKMGIAVAAKLRSMVKSNEFKKPIKVAIRPGIQMVRQMPCHTDLNESVENLFSSWITSVEGVHLISKKDMALIYSEIENYASDQEEINLLQRLEDSQLAQILLVYRIRFEPEKAVIFSELIDVSTGRTLWTRKFYLDENDLTYSNKPIYCNCQALCTKPIDAMAELDFKIDKSNLFYRELVQQPLRLPDCVHFIQKSAINVKRYSLNDIKDICISGGGSLPDYNLLKSILPCLDVEGTEVLPCVKDGQAFKCKIINDEIFLEPIYHRWEGQFDHFRCIISESAAIPKGHRY